MSDHLASLEYGMLCFLQTLSKVLSLLSSPFAMGEKEKRKEHGSLRQIHHLLSHITNRFFTVVGIGLCVHFRAEQLQCAAQDASTNNNIIQDRYEANHCSRSIIPKLSFPLSKLITSERQET